MTETNEPDCASSRTGRLIAHRIAQARKIRGLNQADLARKAGLTPSSISHFETESRRPSLDNLCRLANALGVTLDYLVGRHAEPSQAPPHRIQSRLDALSDIHLDIVERFVDVLAEDNAQDRAGVAS